MDQTLVLNVLIAAVVANVVIIGLALLTVGRRGGGRRERIPALGGILVATPAPSSTRLPTAGLAGSVVGAAASASAASGASAPTTSTTFTTVAAMNDRAPSDPRLPSGPSGRWSLPPHNDPKAESTIHALVNGEGGPEAETAPPGEPLVDDATGFATRRAWDEAFRAEEHRLARYGRSVTLLVAELDGLDSLGARLGQGAADRLIPPVAAAMRRNARAADFLARTGHTRFVAMLPETDEVAAINYVERVRAACDMWLEAGAVAVRLAVGWAQPTAGGRLTDALRLADDRMNADRRRQGLRAAPPAAASVIDDQENGDIEPGAAVDSSAMGGSERVAPDPRFGTEGETSY